MSESRYLWSTDTGFHTKLEKQCSPNAVYVAVLFLLLSFLSKRTPEAAKYERCRVCQITHVWVKEGMRKCFFTVCVQQLLTMIWLDTKRDRGRNNQLFKMWDRLMDWISISLISIWLLNVRTQFQYLLFWLIEVEFYTHLEFQNMVELHLNRI